MLYNGVSSLAQFLMDSYYGMSTYTQTAVTFILGQEVVDAINSGYGATVAYLSNLGFTAFDPILKMLGF